MCAPSPHRALSKREVALFLKSNTVETESGCWNWTAGKHAVGYGCCNAKYGGNRYAHRAMAEAVIGPIPPKMQVMHSCDNRLCINPEHLSFGTQQENIADAKAKGRTRGGSLPNEKNPNVKFTDEQIACMRNRRFFGFSLSKIQSQYNISESHLLRILKNQARVI